MIFKPEPSGLARQLGLYLNLRARGLRWLAVCLFEANQGRCLRPKCKTAPFGLMISASHPIFALAAVPNSSRQAHVFRDTPKILICAAD